MHQHHCFRTLSQRENGYIGYCDSCQSYNVAYQNLLLVFNADDYQYFLEMLKERTNMTYFPTTHGKEIMMRSPIMNLNILLAENELDDLIEMMDELRLLVDAQKILYS
ncbi:DUF6686 family protein [Siphonobacter aquaeclarae]|jgi:hypothetical protein|uniref:Uncharacterized protein n=1 Tax=Siphonobacter aquaeclarae TaxID=563176 RepID=A0A1G9XH55_9BACT|nr:DUF6686 family protein [Siphonobacter aquaeclarae]SDM96149.1 hypothetical protein SAMN04488090_4619 [Siphonobacter aquaeclarae]